MMREANSAMRVLLQMQSARRKLEADAVLSTRADRIDHALTHAFAEALQQQPRAEPAPAPAPVPSPAKAGAHSAEPPAPEPSPLPVPALPAEDPEPDAFSEAEQYAAIYPERAALIRRLGRLPDNVTFGPPDDEIVAALIAGRTPALRALDRAVAA
jgi:hypothetical protein